MDQLLFDKISKQVFEEISSAKNKHPKFPDDLIYKTSVLTEESGEAAREANLIVMENKGSISALRNEVIQAACVCYRILESIEED